MNHKPEKRPRIIKCRWMPKRYCLNFFGTVLTRDASWIDDKVVNHEKIHSAQQRELLWVPFYLLYIAEWLLRLIQYRDRDRAYLNISFEREAYSNGADFKYLKRRTLHAWTHHLFYTKRKLKEYERIFR